MTYAIVLKCNIKQFYNHCQAISRDLSALTCSQGLMSFQCCFRSFFRRLQDLQYRQPNRFKTTEGTLSNSECLLYVPDERLRTSSRAFLGHSLTSYFRSMSF